MAKYSLFLSLIVSYKVKKTGVNGSTSASLSFTLVFFYFCVCACVSSVKRSLIDSQDCQGIHVISDFVTLANNLSYRPKLNGFSTHSFNYVMPFSSYSKLSQSYYIFKICSRIVLYFLQ